jgi:hypothetical protein
MTHIYGGTFVSWFTSFIYLSAFILAVHGHINTFIAHMAEGVLHLTDTESIHPADIGLVCPRSAVSPKERESTRGPRPSRRQPLPHLQRLDQHCLAPVAARLRAFPTGQKRAHSHRTPEESRAGPW